MDMTIHWNPWLFIKCCPLLLFNLSTEAYHPYSNFTDEIRCLTRNQDSGAFLFESPCLMPITLTCVERENVINNTELLRRELQYWFCLRAPNYDLPPKCLVSITVSFKHVWPLYTRHPWYRNTLWFALVWLHWIGRSASSVANFHITIRDTHRVCSHVKFKLISNWCLCICLHDN